MDPSRTRNVLSWNVPASVVDIRRLLRVVGYYRRLNKRSLKITKPMTGLLEKD
jgi:hypothetical protein